MIGSPPASITLAWEPSLLRFLQASAGFLRRKTFAALELSESTLDFLVDKLPIPDQEGFFLVKHLDGALNEFIHRLVRAALNILFNQFFKFGLEVNGHKSTVSHVAIAVGFMMADQRRALHHKAPPVAAENSIRMPGFSV